jgi:hypothetical protein
MTERSQSSRLTAIILAALLASPVLAVGPGTPELPDPGHPGMSREKQEKLGLEAMTEVYKQMPVLPDSSPVTQYVQRLGAKLAQQIPKDVSWPYQFHVIQQQDVNAFALPGGPIFINVGTINAAQNEAQLAGVMSHEMSHVYMQHSAKQATSSKRTIAEILGAAGGIFGGGVLGDIARMGIQVTAGGLLLRYSREDEAQADAVGAIIMYKTGYNPIELANFFEILNKHGGNPPQFLSDHPNPGNRTAAIAKEIRNWPPKNYNTDNSAFLGAKQKANRVPAYSAQEISEGAKLGRWARQNMESGAVPENVRESVANATGAPLNVSFDQIRPSNEFTETRQNSFSISYPYNWSLASGQNSITIAPRAGVGQNAIAYGVVIGEVEDQNAGSIDQVTQDLVNNLQRTNPGMRQTGNIRTINVSGTPGHEVDLTGNSPIQQNGNPLPERDRLVAVTESDGGYLYLIFIAPEKDFGAVQPTYDRMLESLRVR